MRVQGILYTIDIPMAQNTQRAHARVASSETAAMFVSSSLPAFQLQSTIGTLWLQLVTE